jgi:hypothetical protein
MESKEGGVALQVKIEKKKFGASQTSWCLHEVIKLEVH